VETLVDTAYRWLRPRILDGSFAAGDKLRVEHLREQSGIGATPLREALSRLSAERLVQATGQRGFRVAPMSLAELDDVTENRALLEARAVELSVTRGDVAWEAGLVAAQHLVERSARPSDKAKFAAWDAANSAFHDALVAACGSPWLLTMRKELFDLHARYRALAAATTTRRGGRDVDAEHVAIVEAALARRARRAAQLAEAHIRATATIVRASLAHRIT
jgi:GntR family transcriptional regulator, carbon starvation induced regulator